jgi:hypothetical protein
MVGFWWFYSIVVAAYIVFRIRRVRSLRRQIEQEPGVAETTGTPLTFQSALAVIAGTYVASFSWLICLAFRANDRLWAAVITGIMVVLFLWHFLQARSRIEAAALQRATRHVAIAWAIILVILNLRLQVWLATLRGVDLSELHRLLPAWVIPSATLFVVLWVGVLVALTKSQRAISGYGER